MVTMTCWSSNRNGEAFRNCWSSGIFPHPGFTGNGVKRRTFSGRKHLSSLDFCWHILIVGWEFGRKKHESMAPSCLVHINASGCCWWNAVGGPTEHRWNSTAYLSIVVDHQSLYDHKVQIISSWSQWVHWTQMGSTVSRSQAGRAPLGGCSLKAAASHPLCSLCITFLQLHSCISGAFRHSGESCSVSQKLGCFCQCPHLTLNLNKVFNHKTKPANISIWPEH